MCTCRPLLLLARSLNLRVNSGTANVQSFSNGAPVEISRQNRNSMDSVDFTVGTPLLRDHSPIPIVVLEGGVSVLLNLPLDTLQTKGRFTPISGHSNVSTRESSLNSSAHNSRRSSYYVPEDLEYDVVPCIIEAAVAEGSTSNETGFNWSPMPVRKQDHPSEQETMESELNSKDEFVESNSKCYPNCDASVWMRSCGEEVIEPMEGTTTGVIPTWLNGSLLRNGPGNLKVGKMMFNHLFDSSALLHRFAMKDGKATYQCRFIQTDTYQKNKAANRIVVTEFGTRAVPDPCHSIFDKVSVIFKPGESGSDNAMISIYPFGDEFFAFTEQPVVFRINPSTLATEQRINLHETVGIINHTSHPHVLSDGTVYNLGMTVKKMGPFYNIIQFPPGEDMFGKAQIVASVPSRWKFNPGYMHTFGVTENYFIIVEQPLAISVASAIKAQLTNEPLIGSLKWFGDKQTYFYVVDRESGELVHTFCSEAFFYLHIINQFEKDQHLVIDICCYRDPAMLNCMYVESMRNMQSNPDYARMFRGKPVRFVLPLHASNSNNKRTSQISNIFSKLSRTISFDKSNVTEKDFVLANLVNLPESKATAHKLPNNSIFCTPELLCDLGCETPRINYDLYLGREYTYFYAISSDVDAENPGTIIKVNVKDKTRVTWCEPFCYPSEPIFVQAPDATSEDDGVVLCAIVWGGSKEVENRAGVLVLCAKSLTELGRCVFETPSEVPKCLHGWFAPNY